MMPLQIFEKHPTADAYWVGGFYSPYALVSTEKRFRDAELAAEWWRQDSFFKTAWRRTENYPGEKGLIAAREREFDRLRVIERFATLPHFDA